MIGLVLVTHGRLADEFVTAMVHVVGPQERIATIAMLTGDEFPLPVVPIAPRRLQPVPTQQGLLARLLAPRAPSFGPLIADRILTGTAVGRVRAYADASFAAKQLDEATAASLSACNAALAGDTATSGLGLTCSSTSLSDLTTDGASADTRRAAGSPHGPRS